MNCACNDFDKIVTSCKLLIDEKEEEDMHLQTIILILFLSCIRKKNIFVSFQNCFEIGRVLDIAFYFRTQYDDADPRDINYCALVQQFWM